MALNVERICVLFEFKRAVVEAKSHNKRHFDCIQKLASDRVFFCLITLLLIYPNCKTIQQNQEPMYHFGLTSRNYIDSTCSTTAYI